jgi:SPASM domain peptide maturase of grasp-with-spasm system
MEPTLPAKKFLRLFAGCLPVRGARRTVIVDTQRQKHYFVPNGLHALLGSGHYFDVQAALAAHAEQQEVVRQYVDFLLQHELAFLTDEVERFPSLDLTFGSPETISNAVIDVDAGSGFDFGQLAAQLSGLKCKALQLRFADEWSCAQLQQVLTAFADSTLRHVEVFAPDHPSFGETALADLAREVPRLNVLNLYGAATNTVRWYRKYDLRVVYVQEQLRFPGCCGVVQPHYFTYNITHVTEAAAHNSCLHKKIAVDARGNIKNCPSMSRSFGNVREHTLAAAVEQPAFRQVWDITKEQVRVCQDCEFRLICTDCRAYTEDPADAYSKPLKCGYDPYAARWEDWSQHPLKQAARAYYGLTAAPEPAPA